MKTTLITEEDRVQLCLHPENDHDDAVLGVLEKLPNTHRTHLYQRQGGYTAFGAYKESGKDLLIVFDEVEENE